VNQEWVLGATGGTATDAGTDAGSDGSGRQGAGHHMDWETLTHAETGSIGIQ
jgi:hypothetical protein